MSQIYLNGPSVGRAMSAEDFLSGAADRLPDRSFAQRANDGPSAGQYPVSVSAQGCGCGFVQSAQGCTCGCGTTSDCPADGCGQDQAGCCQQMICCCRPAPAPAPQPPQVEEGCCCKQSFRAALSLLCDQQISSLLDFDSAAFITNTYTAGTSLSGGKPSAGEPDAQAANDTGDTGDTGDNAGTAGKPTPSCPSGASDNLGTLSGSFRRFSPCSCDLLDIDAEIYTAGGKSCSFTASQVSLCELDAVVLQGAEACSEGKQDDDVTARNFRCLRTRLSQRLNPCGSTCGQNWCSCACDGRDCCCAAGLLDALARNNISRRVSLVAGLLVLTGVTLLGTVGNVLVLSNDTDNRLYFVCVNSVQFVG